MEQKLLFFSVTSLDCDTEEEKNNNIKTSLLHRLQAQTLPDATQRVSKIHHFSKIAVTFEPIGQFGALQDLESLKKCQHSFYL